VRENVTLFATAYFSHNCKTVMNPILVAKKAERAFTRLAMQIIQASKSPFLINSL